RLTPRGTLFPYTTLFRSEAILKTRFGGGLRLRFAVRVELRQTRGQRRGGHGDVRRGGVGRSGGLGRDGGRRGFFRLVAVGKPPRSEEHTSELQSRSDLVC